MATHPNFVAPVVYHEVQVSVADLIYRSARMARALAHPGQGVSVPSESNEFMDILNAMMDGLKIEGLLIPYTDRTIVPVYQGQKDYGVGPGQDWGIASDGVTALEAPEKIHRAGFLIPGSGDAGQGGPSELQMKIILTFEQYAAFINKNVQSNYPLVLYYKASIPYGTATLFPVPNTDGTIALYLPQLVSEFLTFQDVLLVRKGWREMLMYNLAVAIHEMPPWCDKPMAPSIYENAKVYKMRCKANQLTPIYVVSDPGARQNRFGNNGQWSLFPQAWTPYS